MLTGFWGCGGLAADRAGSGRLPEPAGPARSVAGAGGGDRAGGLRLLLGQLLLQRVGRAVAVRAVLLAAGHRSGEHPGGGRVRPAVALGPAGGPVRGRRDGGVEPVRGRPGPDRPPAVSAPRGSGSTPRRWRPPPTSTGRWCSSLRWTGPGCSSPSRWPGTPASTVRWCGPSTGAPAGTSTSSAACRAARPTGWCRSRRPLPHPPAAAGGRRRAALVPPLREQRRPGPEMPPDQGLYF